MFKKAKKVLEKARAAHEEAKAAAASAQKEVCASATGDLDSSID